MVNVKDVAKWFLHEESMTHKKLQKLCYYAQAWYCALYDGTPLFCDRIEAWIHGPVCPAIYAQYAGYGWEKIPQVEESVSFCEEVEELLLAVYATYHELTGNQLESLTHSELPWKEARGDLSPLQPSHAEISTATMRKFYLELHEQSQGE